MIGNVGKDPDVRYFDSGTAVANFPLATSERGYTLANGTVVPERTEWHNIVVRRDQVAFVEKMGEERFRRLRGRKDSYPQL